MLKGLRSVAALTLIASLALASSAGAAHVIVPADLSAIQAVLEARRDVAVAEPLTRWNHSESNRPPIFFSEPPTVDSLPGVRHSPPLPDSLTTRMGSVAVGDLDGDGLPDIVGVEYSDSTLVIRRNLGGGYYASAVRYALAEGAYWLALADFDGDGHLDVAVGNMPFRDPSTHAYSVLKNRGDGTFGPRFDGNLSALPFKLYAVDLGHDGRADLIFPLFNHASVDVVRSRADGTFEPAFNLRPFTPVDTYNTTSANVADLDGDGNPDILLLYNNGDCFDDRCMTLAVFYGRDDGTFEDPANYQAYDPDRTQEVESVTLQDVDGDDRPDIVVRAFPPHYPGSPTPPPAWIRNAGGRRLEAPFVRHLSLSPIVLAPGRLRYDAPEDLMFSDRASVSILRGRGDGTFSALSTVARGALARVVDLDGDGLSDIIITRADTIEIRLTDGTGGLEPPIVVTAGTFLAVADFTGERRSKNRHDDHLWSERWHDRHGRRPLLDLAVVMPNGHIGILPGNGVGGFAAPIDFGSADELSFPLQAVDLDGDGLADLAFMRPRFLDEDSLEVKWNVGNGFSRPSLFDLGSSKFDGAGMGPRDLAIGDFNGDGLPDLAVVKSTGGGGGPGALAIVLNQGHRSIGPPSPLMYAGEDANQAAIADYDGDGFDDIAVVAMATDLAGRYLVFRSLGDGSLQPMPSLAEHVGSDYAVEHFATCIAASDFNGDGRIDLAVGCGYPYPGESGAVLVVPNISPRPSHIWHRHPRHEQVSIDAATDETRADAPASLAFTLEGVRPNPSVGDRMTIDFVLPIAAPARLELIDISGRRIAEREVGSLGPGRHAVDLANGVRVLPGVYVVRFTQGGSVRVARTVVLQ